MPAPRDHAADLDIVLDLIQNSMQHPAPCIPPGSLPLSEIATRAGTLDLTPNATRQAVELGVTAGQLVYHPWHVDGRKKLLRRSGWNVGYISYAAQGERRRIEDAHGQVLHSTDPQAPRRMVVCDGVGSGRGGHLAARTIVDYYLEQGTEATKRDCQQIVDYAAGTQAATTMSAAEVHNGVLRWIHCGDSALWLLVIDAALVKDPSKVHKRLLPPLRRLTPDQSEYGMRRAQGILDVAKMWKSYINSCVIGGSASTWATPAPEWAEGEIDLGELMQRASDDTQVYLVGTTDGFHEAFELDESQTRINAAGQGDRSPDVDEAALAVELITLIGQKETNAAQVRVELAAHKTGDNATVAIWRLA